MNLTLQDLSVLLPTLLVCACVFLAPGWLLGRLFNVFDWHERSISARLAIGGALSLGAFPVFGYLVAKFFGFGVLVIVYVILSVICLCLLLKKVISSHGSVIRLWAQTLAAEMESFRRFYQIELLWLVAGTLLLIDIQSGGQIFNSQTIVDHAKLVALTDAICRTGVTPENPFYCPIAPIKACYYYFWNLLTAAGAMLLHPHLIDCRLAVTAGCLWTGAIFLGTIPLVVKEVYGREPDYRKVQIIAIGLLAVGGLDLIPDVAQSIDMSKSAGQLMVLPYTGVGWWWNQQIGGWVGSLLWVPHHIAGHVALLLGSLLLRRALIERANYKQALLAAACFASSIGISPYQTIVWALFWAAMGLAVSLQKNWQALKTLVFVAVLSGALAVPFLLELKATNQLSHSAIVFGWPEFSLQFGVPMTQPEFLLVLLRFFVGFAPIAVPIILYWRAKQSSADDLPLALLAVASAFISTFFHSVVHNDDMSWRSIIPCQFVLLLWAARYLAGVEWAKQPAVKTLLIAVPLSVGVMTTVYDVWLLRNVIPIDGPTLLTRAFNLRQVYTLLNEHLPRDARTQQNPLRPDLVGIEPYFSLYGHHQTIAADDHHGPLLGVNPLSYRQVSHTVAQLFGPNMPLPAAQALCQQYQIACVLVTNLDPAWNSPNSWTTRKEPLFENETVKAYLMIPVELH